MKPDDNTCLAYLFLFAFHLLHLLLEDVYKQAINQIKSRSIQTESIAPSYVIYVVINNNNTMTEEFPHCNAVH